MTTPPIPVVTAAGSRYQIGHAHGSALGPRLRAFLADGAARLSHLLPEPVTLAGLRAQAGAYGEAVSAALPALAEEVRGLADGAGISWEEAVLLQARRELLGYRKIPALGDCTTYARTALKSAGQPVLAQTVDLSGDLDDQIAVLRLRPAGQARAVLLLSFAGLLGYLGINSDGLAVGLNLVLGGDWQPGVPPYLAIRHILDEAGTVAEAVKILESLPLASSRSFMLCDGHEAGWVEVLGDDVAFAAATEPAHANHFLHGGFAAADAINVFAAHSSRRRLTACQRGLADLPASAGAEDHFALLSQPPVCVAGTGDIRTERTVAAAVMLPWRGELHLRPGDPSRSATQVFRLAPEPGDRPHPGGRP